MKRTVFLAIAAAALSLGSCSKDDSFKPSQMVVQQFEADGTDTTDVSRPPKEKKEKPGHVQAP